MALTPAQKKEIIEAGAIVIGGILLWYLFHRGQSGDGGLLTPTLADVAGAPISATGDIPSITYNYPAGSGADGLGPIEATNPSISFGYGPTDIGGNSVGGVEVGGNTIGGPSFGGFTGMPAEQCGCCSAPPADGDAFTTPAAAVDAMQVWNPNFRSGPGVSSPAAIPGIITPDLQVMSIDELTSALQSATDNSFIPGSFQ